MLIAHSFDLEVFQLCNIKFQFNYVSVEIIYFVAYKNNQGWHSLGTTKYFKCTVPNTEELYTSYWNFSSYQFMLKSDVLYETLDALKCDGEQKTVSYPVGSSGL